MTDNININEIISQHKEKLVGYKQILPNQLKTNITIKYYDPTTKELSKQATITRIQYYSEITKDKTMTIHLQAGTIKKSWKIICNKYIIFRQYTKEKTKDTEEIRLYKEIFNIIDTEEEK